VNYFKRQLAKSSVAVELGTEFESSAINEGDTDVVIVAAGGSPSLPDIPGINRRKVIKSSDLYGTLRLLLRFLSPKMLRDLTKIWMPVGKKVVIIGGGIQGCQLGEYLVKRGRQVAIVDTGEEMGEGLYPERKTRLFYWFRKKGVSLITGAKLEEVTEKGLTIITKEGQQQTLEADSIIPALPLLPNTDMVKALQGKAPEIYAIGDCEKPGIIPDATAAGWQIANKI
jgi:2,4-dienoyl-CoA reductase (NADPH2)